MAGAAAKYAGALGQRVGDMCLNLGQRRIVDQWPLRDVFLNAGGPVPVQAVGAFTNYGAGGVLFGEYRLTDSFGVNTTIDYQQVIKGLVLLAAVCVDVYNKKK